QDQHDHEYSAFVDRIPSLFNQLTVFDPRLPHGVTEVKGTRNPMEARLVMHGWFVEPRPYVVGGLSTAQVQKVITPQFAMLDQILSNLGPLHGTMSLRMNINASGKIQACQFVSNTVLSLENNPSDEKIFYKEMMNLFKHVQFPKVKTSSMITIPLLFK
ncbi:MAG: hypothetical protein H7235_09615, partial [Bdellovibrionaceae bacterium]|nr:hypothetical protein [Pseudobdellovibrionaceae bacterium]